MNYAIIENGIVTNIAVADEPLGENWIDAGTAGIGDLWDGSDFTPPPPAPIDVNETILNAPNKGFGGPTGKDVFNGNR